MGFDKAVEAFGWGLLSAFSLFLGAVLALTFPTSPLVNGLIMSFGAGALLFAVSIEMFAEGMRELDDPSGRMEMSILMVTSVAGAILYVVINRALTGGKDNSMTHAAKQEMGRNVAAQAGPNRGKDYDPVEPAESGEVAEAHGGHGGGSVAFSIWLGILIDGVPESMMIGFMTLEGELSIAFILAVFLANFPEALSSSALMARQGDSACKIICMWSSLFVGTGLIAGFTALCFPSDHHEGDNTKVQDIIGALSEGLAGGSMMACISTAMLPEAYEEGGDWAGLTTLLGFLSSLTVKLWMEDSDTQGSFSEICENRRRLLAGS